MSIAEELRVSVFLEDFNFDDSGNVSVFKEISLDDTPDKSKPPPNSSHNPVAVAEASSHDSAAKFVKFPPDSMERQENDPAEISSSSPDSSQGSEAKRVDNGNVSSGIRSSSPQFSVGQQSVETSNGAESLVNSGLQVVTSYKERKSNFEDLHVSALLRERRLRLEREGNMEAQLPTEDLFLTTVVSDLSQQRANHEYNPIDALIGLSVERFFSPSKQESHSLETYSDSNFLTEFLNSQTFVNESTETSEVGEAEISSNAETSASQIKETETAVPTAQLSNSNSLMIEPDKEPDRIHSSATNGNGVKDFYEFPSNSSDSAANEIAETVGQNRIGFDQSGDLYPAAEPGRETNVTKLIVSEKSLEDFKGVEFKVFPDEIVDFVVPSPPKSGADSVPKKVGIGRMKMTEISPDLEERRDKIEALMEEETSEKVPEKVPSFADVEENSGIDSSGEFSGHQPSFQEIFGDKIGVESPILTSELLREKEVQNGNLRATSGPPEEGISRQGTENSKTDESLKSEASMSLRVAFARVLKGGGSPREVLMLARKGGFPCCLRPNAHEE